MSWFVYIVKGKDNSYYTGITTNVKRRIAMHNSKTGARSLFGKLPVELVYKETHKDQSSASKREIEVKGWRREKKTLLVQSNSVSSSD